MGVRIVRPYQKAVVEQLGRYKETVDPGLRIIKPVLERLRTVDMREQVIDVPPQEVITQDNVAVSVDAVIYFEPTDPQRLLYNISNFIMAVTKLAQTNLRNVIGEMTLDQAFTSRERVNTAPDIRRRQQTQWGVRGSRGGDPTDRSLRRRHATPMHEQMKAERTRRAVGNQSRGRREAAVTRPKGVRQRDILMAEGEAQATRTRAEAEQYRQEVVADGEADAIRSVYGAITDSGTDDRVIAIKYLEALQGIADGRATKIFIPAEMGATLGTLGGIAEMLKDGDFPEATEPPPSKRRRGSDPAPAVSAGQAPQPVAATPQASTAAELPVPRPQHTPPSLPPAGTPPPPPLR
ncbi:UNVERIFIED_CONTAM: hypothetical protein GTU68_016441 [Idotea baltica]|nr:hypothetical protein [Idotea baltica]